MGYIMVWKLFIDDERFPANADFIIARNSYDAIWMTKTYGMPIEIAFDHDLGGQDTSINYISWLTRSVVDGEIEIPEGFVYSVHSQNPVGKVNIISKMDQLIKHYGDCE